MSYSADGGRSQIGQNTLGHTKPKTAASGVDALETTAPNGRDADATR